MLQYKYSIVLYVTKLGGSYLKAMDFLKKKKKKKNFKPIDNLPIDLVEEPAL